MRKDRIILDPITKKFINIDKYNLEPYMVLYQAILCVDEKNTVLDARISRLLRLLQNPEFKIRLQAILMGQRYRLGKYTGNRKKYSKSMKARWANPEYAKKMFMALKLKPNKSELKLQFILNKYFPGTYKYTGDGQFIIDGKCPDFTNIDGKKEVIELFGSYWHTPNEVGSRIEHFARFGYTCLIIWEEELDDENGLIRHVNSGGFYTPRHTGKYHEKKVLSDEDIRFRELKAELKACIESYAKKSEIPKGVKKGSLRSGNEANEK